MTNRIHEKHGVERLERWGVDRGEYTEHVVVTDGIKKVLLYVSHSSGVKLTPAEARLLARQIIESADRCEVANP